MAVLFTPFIGILCMYTVTVKGLGFRFVFLIIKNWGVIFFFSCWSPLVINYYDERETPDFVKSSHTIAKI